jgi:hypothetical protein
MNNLTPARTAWLRKHPEYSPIGRPRPGVRFHQVGTLHGAFEPLQNLVAVKLRGDCMSVLVGVAVKPMSELR